MRTNVIGVVNKVSYGIVTRNIIKSMCRLGISPSLFPINTNHELEPEELPYLQQAAANGEYFEAAENCVRIWHQHDMSHMVGKGKHIGFPIFELNKFKPLELE